MEGGRLDKLSFVAALITAIAWPTAVIVLGFALKGPFRELLGFLTKLKYGDLELNFEKSLQRLELKATAALPPETAGTSLPLLSPELARLAEASPRAAIIEGWIRLSNAAVAALRSKTGSAPTGRHLAPATVERGLVDSHLLNDAELAVVRQLRNMRNAAVHGVAFSADAGVALQYTATANRLVRLLERRSKP